MSSTSPTPAEQHLGDRLAALVDGELKHDARERVLAHLATCPKCKAEADAQRRLKSVFATAAPPPPSEGLLARLQGLPAGPPGGDDDGRGGPHRRGRPGDGVFGVTSEGFGYVPGGHGLPDGGPGSGFRIHDVARQEAERSAWRGRRFAFAAASAVSFAAIALGGSLPLAATGDASARGDNRGNNVTPLRTATTGAGTEANRRRGGGTGVTGISSTPVVAIAPQTLVRTRPPSPPFAASSPLTDGGAVPPSARPTASAFQLATAPGPSASASPQPSRFAAPHRR
ncbi:zf-HC2 domain-containing protein [Streptomyces sp. HNM0645]|uniref:anti-sigma factor family protein n=1 Tax=Streptomyces sp. HNM0645 TaxID=2782343 RepID=UPI0024B6A9A7|nr:zf-HC2 domain-containing protein [Streptomyces sp. HNM0645]MDI9883507.1 zf-HC2 domain-containing protein [Streptomyces sp. HNM0645]